MAKITSHLLNSVDGSHAGGISVSFKNCVSGSVLFTTQMDDGGRLNEDVDPAQIDHTAHYELVFEVGSYWSRNGFCSQSTIDEIVLRFKMPDSEGSYHLPVIIGPHSYSTWKSA